MQKASSAPAQGCHQTREAAAGVPMGTSQGYAPNDRVGDTGLQFCLTQNRILGPSETYSEKKCVIL